MPIPILPTGGGSTGESNTASSQGSGTSIFYQKSGVDLQFNAIKSENSLLTVALDGVTHDVELTVNEGNIDHDNLTNTHNLTTDIDHDQLTNFDSSEHFTQAAISITESQISDLDHDDSDAIHDNVAGEINAITEKGTPVSADLIIIEDSADSNNKKKVQVGNLPTGGGGEANTASSQGSGTSIYYQKSGIDLQFNAIKSENSLLTVSLDGVSHDVELTINEANFVLDGVTLQIDGINSDGGDFTFSASGDITLKPDGATSTDYAIFKVYNSDPWLTFVTSASGNTFINSSSKMNFAVDADANNYIRFTTPSSIPILTFIGNQGNITNLADPSAAQDAATKNYVDTGGAGRDTTAIHDNVASEISAITEKGTPVSADLIIIEDSADSNNKKRVQIGNLPTGGGGEANTASSQGSGTSIYYQKSGVDLQFNAIKSENSLLTVSLDAGTHDVELTVNESSFTLDGVTAQIDGINSDGGIFSFATSGQLDLKPSGDTTHYVQFATISNIPDIYMIGNTGGRLRCSGGPLTLQSGGNIRFQSNDTDNYVEFSTTTDIPKIDFVGGNNGLITNLADPTNAQDAATKNYVDTATPAAHDHDGDTLQHNGVTSDGGDFSFSISGDLLIKPYSISTDNLRISRDAFNMIIAATAGTRGIDILSANDILFKPDSEVSNYIQVSSVSSVATLTFVGNQGNIINLADPTNDQDAATKKFVDDHNWVEADITDLDHTDTDAIHDDVASEIYSITEKGTPVSADVLIIEDSADSYNKKRVQVGNLPTGGGGEANTASSQGSGTSIYYQKSGVDLQFNAIKSENSLLTVSLDGVSHDVELTVNESSFTLDGVTAQIDGINSDGGAFNFDTSGALNIRPSGDTDDYLQILTTSDQPIIKAIGDSFVQFQSNVANFSGIEIYHGTGNLQLANYDYETTYYCWIRATNSDSEIRIQPNNDSTNYFEFSSNTTPTLTYIGTPGQIINQAFIEFNDQTAPSDPASGYSRLFLDSATGELSVRKSDSSTVSLEGSGDNLGNHTATENLDLAGYEIESSGAIGLLANGDNDDYLEITTDGSGQVQVSRIGGGWIDFISDSASEVRLRLYESPTSYAYLGLNKTDDLLEIYSSNEIKFFPNGDIGDYWQMATPSNIPTLSCPGANGRITDIEYIDIEQISTPANPASGTRRLFVDSADGHIKVRTSAGSSVDLEGGGVSALDDLSDVTLSGVAQGDLLIRGASVWGNVALGTSGYFLKAGATDPAWAAITEADISDLDHDDVDAIHDNVAGEITAITEKTTLVANDEFLIEDSAASDAKKSAKISAIRITESQVTDLGSYLENLSEDTTPQLGGDLDLNDKGIAINTDLTSNSTYEGTILELTVSGLTFGQCVYVSGNNAGSLADADASSTMPAVGIYVGTNKVLTHGVARYDTWNWTAGQRLYVGTDGNLTSTAPSGTGDYIQIMGIAVNADAVLIMPSLTEVVHT